MLQDEPPETALESPLLDLVNTSDVNPILPEQVADARAVLRLRRQHTSSPWDGSASEVVRLQRQIVERYLSGRRAYFGTDQVAPLDGVPGLVDEQRDIFVVIKFMDEAPHIAATVLSLLNQTELDMNRLVIVAVDNQSTDGSDSIMKELVAATDTPVRFIYLNQPVPGAGNAARLGVDRAIATVHAMCLHDNRWDRLQSAIIGVSDGDTVYHPNTISEAAKIFDGNPLVDGVMPFLVYKFTAALRLFSTYQPACPDELARQVRASDVRQVGVSLADLSAHDALPRRRRRRIGDVMALDVLGGETVLVPLTYTDNNGRRFGVIRDSAGRLGYVYEDRGLVLGEAAVSGFDAALVFLENGGVGRAEKWRWHALVGHDLFLYWAFAGLGLPEEMIYPDTSDALKVFRAWSFAIGGQHQLARRDLRIATGSDYQSGRVLQAVGNTVRFGPAHAFAETETDRLIKMVRNLARSQPVFYGQTRSDPLHRATGLYLHMTRIQADIEREVRNYPDELFEYAIFPERVLFPLRWIVQNAVRFYAHASEDAKRTIRDRVLAVMFSKKTAARVERVWLDDRSVAALRAAPSHERQAVAERIAENIIGATYPELMAFYRRCLRSFMQHNGVAAKHFEWLLEGLETSRNAILESPPPVDPATVWHEDEFVIDSSRGQVLRVR